MTTGMRLRVALERGAGLSLLLPGTAITVTEVDNRYDKHDAGVRCVSALLWLSIWLRQDYQRTSHMAQ
jgi:hypothetical protein